FVAGSNTTIRTSFASPAKRSRIFSSTRTALNTSTRTRRTPEPAKRKRHRNRRTCYIWPRSAGCLFLSNCDWTKRKEPVCCLDLSRVCDVVHHRHWRAQQRTISRARPRSAESPINDSGYTRFPKDDTLSDNNYQAVPGYISNNGQFAAEQKNPIARSGTQIQVAFDRDDPIIAWSSGRAQRCAGIKVCSVLGETGRQAFQSGNALEPWIGVRIRKPSLLNRDFNCFSCASDLTHAHQVQNLIAVR